MTRNVFQSTRYQTELSLVSLLQHSSTYILLILILILILLAGADIFASGFEYNPTKSSTIQFLTSTAAMNAMPTHGNKSVSHNYSLFSESSNYPGNLAKRRRWLVVDFDGTCTQRDTTPLLPTLAALATRGRSKNSTEENVIHHERDLERRLSQFKRLEHEFLRRLEEAKSKWLPSGGDSSIHGEESLELLHAVLDALDEPSTFVTNLVSESRVLRGLGHADSSELEGMIKSRSVGVGSSLEHCNEESTEYGTEGNDGKVEVRMRQGCESTLARILSSSCSRSPRASSCLGWSIAVLSINWCPALIDASLIRPVLRRKHNILGEEDCDTEIPIWSNSVDAEGVVTLHVPGALAKRDRIVELRRCLVRANRDGRDGGNSTTKNHVIVYVGDSSTDLAALLEADVGIIMGGSSSTRKLAERWGINVFSLKYRHRHGFGFPVNQGVDGKVRLKLWEVEDWQEINEMLVELDAQWELT